MNKVMKWILFICCLFGTGTVAAQEFLGETESEVRRFIGGKGIEAVVAGDTIGCRFQEEDERGRIFDVAYDFVMKDGHCDSYRKVVALHEYWVGVVKELVDLKEGEGGGEPFDVEGEELFPVYRFEDSVLKLEIRAGNLYMVFSRAKG